ncbi:hypothetical protein [Paenibacillus woosongensis]|uniref:Uncharacterized protein n=1 Tax=Paenibacillus woosongensis TaxID=307580 RepID=A0ABQ4MPI2_9BACL|nr:hypothetical protein [Paenibacillus woosongensis]GIP57881.1 hypothetical protein J15TS10_16950 [Paenibacillus woosongensis]
MPVQITINGESATQAIEEFAILSAAFVGQAVLEATSSTEEPKKQSRKPTPKKKEEPEEKKVDVESEDDDSSVNDETQEGAAPKHTLVELRAFAKDLSAVDASTKPKIKKILTEFGYANMSAVEDKDVDAIYAKLEAL